MSRTACDSLARRTDPELFRLKLPDLRLLNWRSSGSGPELPEEECCTSGFAEASLLVTRADLVVKKISLIEIGSAADPDEVEVVSPDTVGIAGYFRSRAAATLRVPEVRLILIGAGFDQPLLAIRFDCSYSIRYGITCRTKLSAHISWISTS